MKHSKLPESVLVAIDQLHPEGYGIARSETRKFAVFGALPGESVQVRPVKRRGKLILSRVETLLEPSASRVQPICAHSEVCAGCCMQHLEGSAQVRFKEAQLRGHLGEHLPATWLPAIVGPVRAYRSKARLGVKFVDKKGKLLIGFREKMSNYIAEGAGCPVLVDSVARLLPGLNALISELACCKAIPQIEVAAGDQDVALIIRHLEPLAPADEERLREFGAREDIQLYLQPAGPDSVHRIVPREGPERLRYRMEQYAIEMSFHPLDFTQVNLEANRRMVARAVELLAPRATDRLLDLFCGIGNLTLPLARSGAETLGIEGSAAAVERARENAAHNGIDNVRFNCADLYQKELPPELASGEWNMAVIDPPRSGAEGVCRGLLESGVEKLLYISCNPVTLARDCGILVAGGYVLDAAGIIDMFPHTSHVESMALFRRDQGN